MSANGRECAKFESASHPDRHGTNLGQAGARSRDWPKERTLVAGDFRATHAGEPPALGPNLTAVGRPGGTHFPQAEQPLLIDASTRPSSRLCNRVASSGWRNDFSGRVPWWDW